MSFSNWIKKKENKEKLKKKEENAPKSFDQWREEEYGIENTRHETVAFPSTSSSSKQVGGGSFDDDIAPVKETEKKEKWYEGWVDTGAFDDGYQFGDVFKTMSGTGVDLSENIMAGILGMGEKAVDAGAYVAGAVGGMFSDDFKESTEDFIKKDLYDEKKVARAILKPQMFLNYAISDPEEDSLFDDKTDALAQSGGELLGTMALQAAGVPWFVTTGATSFGGEVENAFNQGATYGEAGASAAITAGAEILTEKLSGGISFGGNTLDDVLTKQLTTNISNKVVRTMAKLGMDVVGEGSEEVVSQVFSNLGSALYREESLSEILASEEAVNEYIESFIGGAVLGGAGSGSRVVNSMTTGRDATSGLTANEEKVFKQIYDERIAEAEQDGKKLTAKEKAKIYDEVMQELEKGYISTDKIESVLGGETYKSYQDTIESEESAIKELESLYEGEELTQAVNNILENSKRTELKNQLGKEVSELTAKDSYLAESYYEAERRKQKFEADLSKYDAKTQETIKKAVDSGILNNTTRTHEFVDMIAKISADKGVLFDFTNNEKLAESGFAVDGKSVNGYYANGGVTVNIDSEKSLNSIVGHEITHVLEGTEFYDALQETIFEYAKTKGVYESMLKDTYDLYKNIDGYKGVDGFKAIKREVVSDLVGDYLFTDADFINNLSTTNRNVFQKIYDEIKYLYKIATAGSKEARELEKVKRAFEQAYKGEGKANTDTKYSLSDSDGKKLTKEQNEYFKDSKMRDENGALKVMYHGSQDAGFHTFDSKFSDDDTSFFFVDRNDVAASYSGTTETYEARTIRTVEDMNNFLAEIGEEDYKVIEENGKFTLLQENEKVADSDTAQGIYEEYCDWVGVGYGDANYKVYLNIKNPLVVDAKGRNWNRLTSEFSQEVYDRIKSLTAEEKAALTDLAGWEDSSVFRDEIQTAVESVERGASYVDEHIRNLASAAEKLGDTDMYRLFDIASDNFSEESLKENAVKYLKTRDYAQRAKEGGYDGVIFKNIVDNGGYADGTEGASTVAIAFNSNQIKSVANEKPTANKDIRYSLSKESDKAYLDAVNRGETETAQKMVDEAAKNAGYTIKAYHGTPNTEFTVFDKGRLGKGNDQYGAGFYFATDKEAATHYGKRVIGTALNIKNPIRITATADSGTNLIDADVTLTQKQAYEVIKRLPNIYDAEESPLGDYYDSYWEEGAQDWMIRDLARKNRNVGYLDSDLFRYYPNELHEALRDIVGYDGVEVTFEKTGEKFYVAWFDNQMKSTDAVTYDDSGKVIPLSERFNADNNDIRYTLSENGKAPKAHGRYNVYGKDVRLEQDIAPVVETVKTDNETENKVAYDLSPEPMTEEEANALQSENAESLTDEDAPPETEAPYYGETEEAAPEDPFEERDIDDVGNRKVNAYMYENPEVKPFFQNEANVMLGELRDTTKGERWYNDKLYYDTNGERGFFGTQRHTSNDIAYLLDELGYTYAEIEKGLNNIIEDNGKENNACSKRIEFLLNDRLLKGYQDMDGAEIPADEDYIRLLREKESIEYSEEARKKFFEVADDYAPIYEQQELFENKKPTENAATVRKGQQKLFDDSKPKAPEYKGTQEKLFDTGKTAEILESEPETEKKKARGWSRFRTNFLDKQSVFEDLALKTKNRDLMGKANHMLSSESRAQWMIGNGAKGTKSLNAIREEVDRTGLTKQFYEYMYHKHNIDRMSLEDKAKSTVDGLQGKFSNLKESQIKAIAAKEITSKTTAKTAQTIREARQYLNAAGAKNKPVFGDSVTADDSRKVVSTFEKAHPKFKEYAKDVYDYMNNLRQRLVDSGVISQETAALWSEMYPHYVPIRRLGDSGLNINVPLDTGRTGVNAPIKRATGGNRDILPLFDTMAMRTEQTFKAIAKNNFGVELKNTLGTTIQRGQMSLDEMIDNIDRHEELLKKGENGMNPTFTVFENGERVEFEISEDMYDALKPTSDVLRYTNPIARTASNIHKGLLTEYNPVFAATNAIKDAQDILINSQHPARTYANIPNALWQMARKGEWYKEYMENGGEQNTYFDGQSNTFKKEDTGIKKVIGIPLRTISFFNNAIERVPRLAEYMASRKKGASIETSMLDAARVTTNFSAGGDVTKFLNRNGATFLNASVQGFNQQVRNIREAKANGLKGWVQLATKTAIAGLPALLLNNLLWDDDEEYAELSDYVKENYYVVAKYGDGKFVRIPKGRTLAVIQNAFEQVNNALTGDDEIDLESFLELAISNLAPNNPIDNNILAPIMQVANNETWYGEDLVPSRLQDLPDAEQYDESTDALSKWLGEKLDYSPYKINYLLNQYSGGIGDVLLPMGTPEAESGNNSLAGNLLAPLKDKFTTDSVMNNQNVSDFYDTVDELTKNAKSMNATDEDVLKYKYMNSVNAELGELYAEKREIQNSDISDERKYNLVRRIQEQIDNIAKESLGTYGNVSINGGYATVGDLHYRTNKDGEWEKISDKQLEKQEEVTRGLGISASDYWSNKEEYDYAYDYPEKYAVAKAVGGYESYKTYSSELYDIHADKDENGKSISGSRKEKVIDYINNLDADYYEKIILFKSEYNADDTYNEEIIEYLNGREDISYKEMESILKELGFTVDKNGNISWD